MTDYRRDEQDDDQGRQQPDRSYDEIGWKRQIDCADRQKGEQRLPARFRFVDMLVLIRHNAAIAKIRCRANQSLFDRDKAGAP